MNIDSGYSGVIDPESDSRMVYATDEYHDGWALDAIAAAVTGMPIPERSVAHPPQQWFYFIQAGDDGPIKIGYSKDPKHRFVTLQTGSLVRHHYLGNMPGDRNVERSVQRKFQQSHLRGEWYEPDPALLDFIETYRFRADTHWTGDLDLIAEAVTR